MGKRTKKEIDLIFEATPNDYKGIVDGVKHVLYLHPQYGTIYGPIKSLPPEVFNDRLKTAAKKFNNKISGVHKVI